MRILFLAVGFFCVSVIFAQDIAVDSVSEQPMDTTLTNDMLLMAEPDSVVLLPEKMMLTQKVLYGKKGLLRSAGLLPLTVEGRKKEMVFRRYFLVTHQLVGYATLASMLGAATTGILLYNGRNVRDIHEGVVAATNAGYIAGAVLALFGPPPLIYRGKGKWDSIDWHKCFAYMHMAGMIGTNILSGYAEYGGNYRLAHGIAGGFTALTFTAAFVSIKF